MDLGGQSIERHILFDRRWRGLAQHHQGTAAERHGAVTMLRHPRIWKAGQGYLDPMGNGTWVVEAHYAGPAMIYGSQDGPLRSQSGIIHFRNQDLGVRVIAMADDPRLENLTRI